MPQPLRLNFATHGDPQHNAVMLLHGFLSCNAQWLLNVDALAERYFLVTVELWGHGDSPTPTDASYYTLAEYYHQFEAIRNELAIESWVVVGQSYGAGIALNYAKTHIDVCTGVVATNSRSAFGTPSAARERSATDKKRTPPQDVPLRELPFHPVHARRFPEHVKAALVEKADAMQPIAVALSGTLGASLNCRDLVEDYPLPLLVTNGMYEKHFQDDMTSLRGRYPALHVADLEGGHSVNVEAAEGFNAAVLSYLSTLS